MNAKQSNQANQNSKSNKNNSNPTAMLIPAIDLKNGQCVRLKQGKMDESISYSTNPLEMAKHWQQLGAKRLHLVDLDGAFAGEPKNLSWIEKIAHKLNIDIQVGGGIRSQETASRYFSAGVSEVIIGTKAIEDPLWFNQMIEQFPNQVILGLDAYDDLLATQGWQKTSKINLFDFAKKFDHQALFAIIYTDISRDGMLSGINWKQTTKLAISIKTKVIASGGLSDHKDIRDLKENFQASSGNLMAAIAGKSLYEKTIHFEQAQEILNSN